MQLNIRHRKNFSVLLSAIFIGLILFSSTLPVDSSASENDIQKTDSAILLQGKDSLDKGDYESAISQLTTAYEKLPILGDYALFWRAKAYEGKEDIDKAIADLRIIKE
ncbi:MAG: tetratricopeptide repeat protein, partial [Nitrospiraceae bacterium]|nr:tetratricopeptide repeat protein [Nitrospiraceae bacterium]